MAKNLMAKTRPVDDPYEVWKAGGWEWRVLKKWQADDFKPFARWFCSVTSPHTFGMADMGDTYAAEVMATATLAETHYSGEDRQTVERAPFPEDGGAEVRAKARKVLAEMRRLSGGMVG